MKRRIFFDNQYGEIEYVPIGKYKWAPQPLVTNYETGVNSFASSYKEYYSYFQSGRKYGVLYGDASFGKGQMSFEDGNKLKNAKVIKSQGNNRMWCSDYDVDKFIQAWLPDSPYSPAPLLGKCLMMQPFQIC